jgi:hypothetical protein
MASSNQGGGSAQDGGSAFRHTGRGFASMDPERQREVPDSARTAHQRRADEDRRAASAARNLPHDTGGNQGGSHGAGGRR